MESPLTGTVKNDRNACAFFVELYSIEPGLQNATCAEYMAWS